MAKRGKRKRKDRNRTRRSFKVVPGDPHHNVAGEPLKWRALYPSERTKVCDHPNGFPYSGSMPCTGPKRCELCYTHEEDA